MTIRTAFYIILTCLLAGCGAGDGSNSPGAGSGSVDEAALRADFQSIQDNVFTPICVDCHIAATAPEGLRLDPANSFALLVGVPSSQEPGLLRVNPGDPDASYLIRKLEGSAGNGLTMPIGLPTLPQADIDVIRQWISDGAAAPSAAPPGGPIRVSSLLPLPQSILHAFPESIIVVFDRELDATSLDWTTFVLERTGGDGIFDNGNDITVVATTAEASALIPRTGSLDLSDVEPVNDLYRVRLAGNGGATIRDLDANALDGEFDGTFPSGDGAQGGDFEAVFAVYVTGPR